MVVYGNDDRDVHAIVSRKPGGAAKWQSSTVQRFQQTRAKNSQRAEQTIHRLTRAAQGQLEFLGDPPAMAYARKGPQSAKSQVKYASSPRSRRCDHVPGLSDLPVQPPEG